MRDACNYRQVWRLQDENFTIPLYGAHDTIHNKCKKYTTCRGCRACRKRFVKPSFSSMAIKIDSIISTTRIDCRLFMLTKITQTFTVSQWVVMEITVNIIFSLKCACATVVKITFLHWPKIGNFLHSLYMQHVAHFMQRYSLNMNRSKSTDYQWNLTDSNS